MVAGSKINVQLRDYTGETTTAGIPTVQIDAANLGQWLTDYGALKTTLDDIILGVQAHETVNLYNTDLSAAIPASKVAQRESKLKFIYKNVVTGDTKHFTVGTADLASLTFAAGPAGFSDYIVLDDGGVMAAFVAAAETIMAWPDDHTQDCEIVSCQAIGVNS